MLLIQLGSQGSLELQGVRQGLKVRRSQGVELVGVGGAKVHGIRAVCPGA